MAKPVFPAVRRKGIVFTPGDYSDRGIGNVTEADIEAIAAASTEPAPFNVEHAPSPLDGVLGEAFNFSAAPNDAGIKCLWAEWDEPAPMAELLGDRVRRVSLEFANWLDRKVTGIALCSVPRVKEAAFFKAIEGACAAFAAGKQVIPLRFGFETLEERDAIPLEDFGDAENKLFPVRTQDELRDAMRHIWHAADPTTVKANIIAIAERKKLRLGTWPWPVSGVSAPLPEGPTEDYYFALDNNRQKTDNSNIHEELSMSQQTNNGQVAAAPVVAASSVAATPPVEITPTALQKLAAFFGWTPKQTADAQAAMSKTPRELELEAEIERRNAEDAQRQAATFSAGAASRLEAAKAKAEELRAAGHILPYQVEDVAAQFGEALDADAADPQKVKFSVPETVDGKTVAKTVQGTRAQRLEATFRMVPKSTFTDEVIPEFDPSQMAAFSNEATMLRSGQTEAVDQAVYGEMAAAAGLVPAGK